MASEKTIKVTQEEMDMIEKMKNGYWVTDTMGMGKMWHIEGSTLDHKATDDDIRIIKQLESKGIIKNDPIKY